MGNGAAAARAALPISTGVCSIFVCPSDSMSGNVGDFLTGVHNFMLMLSIAHGGYTRTARESAQKADFGYIPSRDLSVFICPSVARLSVCCFLFCLRFHAAPYNTLTKPDVYYKEEFV